MRKLLLAGLISICPLFVLGEDVLTIGDFTEGIHNNLDRTLIPDNSVYDSLNVFFDEDAPVVTRSGMVKLNTIPIGDSGIVASQYEYKKSDGNLYHIANSSETVYYRSTGAEFSVIKNGISSTYGCNYVVFMDTLTVVDGINNMWSWDTSHTFTQNSTYQPRYIIAWQNRLWIAGDSTDGYSRLRACEYLDPSDYSIEANPTANSPVLFDINSQDGQDITGLFLSPNGNLGILKDKSVWEIGGYDRNDFYLRLAIPDIGCVSPQTIRNKGGLVYWLSDVGIIEYSGSSYQVVSDSIYPIIDTIKQLDINSGSISINTEPEWNEFTLSTGNISVSDYVTIDSTVTIPTSSGYELMHPFVYKDTTTLISHFVTSAGDSLKYFTYNAITDTFTTARTVDTNVSARAYIPLPKECVVRDDVIHIAYAKYGGSTHSVYYASSTIPATSFTPKSVATAGVQVAAVAADSSGNPYVAYWVSSVLYVSSYTATTDAWTSAVVDPSATSLSFLSMDIDKNASPEELHFAYNVRDGSNYLIRHARGDVGGTFFVVLPVVTTTDILPYKAIDIAVSQGSVGYISYYNNSDNTFYLRHQETGWPADITVPAAGGGYTATRIGIDADNFLYAMLLDESNPIKQIVSHGLTSFESSDVNGDGIIWNSGGFSFGLNSYPVAVYSGAVGYRYYLEESSGTYYSKIYDTEDTAPEMDLAKVIETGSKYNKYHSIRSSDSISGIAGESWTLFESNTIPSITGSQYIQYKLEISSPVIADYKSGITDTVDSVLIQYRLTGAGTPTTSMLYDDRVWFGVSVSSIGVLDTQLVYDSNGAWAKCGSEIPLNSLTIYNNDPYWGSNDGYIYTMDVGLNDDGNSIEHYIDTKAYTCSAIDQMKTLDKIFFIGQYLAGSSVKTEYFMDRNSSAYDSFDTDMGGRNNLIVHKFAPSSISPFYTIHFKISSTVIDNPWGMFGLRVYYNTLPLE